MDYSNDPLINCQSQMVSFWELIRVEIDNIRCDHNSFKTQDLPLARIKKIMKLDDDIKCMMISAEAPILFAKAAELFIRELTLRAWIHTERNRRRTLQRNDIAMAVSDGETDQFDFLIDIVPREEARGHRRPPQAQSLSGATANSMNAKGDNNIHTANYITNANGTHTLSIPQGSSSVVVSAIPNEANSTVEAAAAGGVNNSSSNAAGAVTASQPQTVTVALTTGTGHNNNNNSTNNGNANTNNNSTVTLNSNLACQTVVQAHQSTAAVQFATTSLGTSQTGSTVAVTTQTSGGANATAPATAPFQYVFQLPVGAGGAAGQPFQIQVLPQQFQAASTDALSAAQTAGTILTDSNGNTIPVLQVVSQAGGLTLPILQEANGNRAQILQLQMSDTSTGQRPTLFLQQAGTVINTPMGAVITGVDGQAQPITYSLQTQPLMHSDSTSATSQVILSLGPDSTECLQSLTDTDCPDSSDSTNPIHTVTTTTHLIETDSKLEFVQTTDHNTSGNLSNTSVEQFHELDDYENFATPNPETRSTGPVTQEVLMSASLMRRVVHLTEDTPVEIHDSEPDCTVDNPNTRATLTLAANESELVC